MIYFLVQWPDGRRGIYSFFSPYKPTLDLDNAARLCVCTCGRCDYHKHSGRVECGLCIEYSEILDLPSWVPALRTSMSTAHSLEEAAINIYEIYGALQ